MRVNSINTNNIYFGKKSNFSKELIQKRKNHLRYLGLKAEDYNPISQFSQKRYERVDELLQNNCYAEYVVHLSKLPRKKFERALELTKHGIVDCAVMFLVDKRKPRYERVLKLNEDGIDATYLENFSNLTEREFKKAQKMMKKGVNPLDAPYLAQLTKEEEKLANELMELGISSENANMIVISGGYSKFKDLLSQGIPIEAAVYFQELNEAQLPYAIKYLNMGLGAENSFKISRISHHGQYQALNLFQEGVMPEYILTVMEIENDPESENKQEYLEYRKRGYSRTCSCALTLMNDEDIKRITKILKTNKEPFKYFKDDYDIIVLPIQGTNLNQMVMTKEMQLSNGTKVTIVRTFDDADINTESRLETYPDGTTSSFMSNNMSDIFRIKLDEYKNIKDMTQYVKSPETKEITSVIHTKESDLLKGAYETTYYKISDFKTSDDIDNIDNAIENSVSSSGIPISKVTKDNDDNIIFEEAFTVADSKVKRRYVEKKDNNGDIIHTEYSYNIKNINGDVLIDISRSFNKNSDGTATNIINGVKYQIAYDDDNKTVTITDGKNTKTVNFKTKLAHYYKDLQWNIIKNLQVDSILTIDKDIDYWNYCAEGDSASDGYFGLLSTGKNLSVIYHELGHFISNETQFFNDDEIFRDSYEQEMTDFTMNIPFNEQNFMIYLTPLADIKSANGRGEFAAEANLVLSTYGTNENELKSRPFFLVRYCPETIARAAELLGKTSTKSLLEE